MSKLSKTTTSAGAGASASQQAAASSAAAHGGADREAKKGGKDKEKPADTDAVFWDLRTEVQPPHIHARAHWEGYEWGAGGEAPIAGVQATRQATGEPIAGV